MDQTLSIGEVSARTGVATSAIRFYEDRGLISSTRTSGNQRRFPRHILRRVSFIRAAQRVGLTLEDIAEALSTLPEGRTPTKSDWVRLSRSWRPRIDAQILRLEALRDRLTGCIGCGCLSLKTCTLLNPGDALAAEGPGPRRLFEET